MTEQTQTQGAARPLRVAIIGAGPAGIYTADMLAKSEAVKSGEVEVSIDLFDRYPTPFGLIRYGVAPDHLTIKSVTKGFEKTLGDPRVRFLGNVEFGRDITLAEIKEHYDATVYTVGASSDRRLGIPGEELKGSLSATEFVAWYNGHPDAATRDMLLNATGVAVVGDSLAAGRDDYSAPRLGGLPDHVVTGAAMVAGGVLNDLDVGLVLVAHHLSLW